MLQFTTYICQLTSGVGNVVLQVAGSTHCGTCYGIEIDQTRHEMGLELLTEFEKSMRFSHGKITLKQGDFTKDSEIKKLLQKARLIYVNNFAFGAELNNSLKQILAECCSEGTAIVTSLCLGGRKKHSGRKVTKRNCGEFEAMVDIVELCSGSVSWTNKPVSLYLQVINKEYLRTFGQPSKQENKKTTESILKMILNKNPNKKEVASLVKQWGKRNEATDSESKLSDKEFVDFAGELVRGAVAKKERTTWRCPSTACQAEFKFSGKFYTHIHAQCFKVE